MRGFVIGRRVRTGCARVPGLDENSRRYGWEFEKEYSGTKRLRHGERCTEIVGNISTGAVVLGEEQRKRCGELRQDGTGCFGAVGAGSKRREVGRCCCSVENRSGNLRWLPCRP